MKNFFFLVFFQHFLFIFNWQWLLCYYHYIQIDSICHASFQILEIEFYTFICFLRIFFYLYFRFSSSYAFLLSLLSVLQYFMRKILMQNIGLSLKVTLSCWGHYLLYKWTRCTVVLCFPKDSEFFTDSLSTLLFQQFLQSPSIKLPMVLTKNLS